MASMQLLHTSLWYYCSAFYLFGVSVFYLITNTMSISSLSLLLAFHSDASFTVGISLFFIILGLTIKLGVAPLHHWVPHTYTYTEI